MTTRSVVMVTLGLGGLAFLVWLAIEYVEPRRQARDLREEVRATRMAVDSCRMALSREQADFQAYDDRVDSLQRRVEEYEGLHPEGVPADSFQAYMEMFDQYNDAVPRWEARAESLRGRWRTCRALTNEHNVLVDSLRGLLAEIGALPDTAAGQNQSSGGQRRTR